MDGPNPNPIIQSRHMRILLDPHWSGMSPGSQRSRNTTSNGVSEPIVWSNYYASWEHEFTNWQCANTLMKCANYLLTTGKQYRSSILNKVICSWCYSVNCYKPLQNQLLRKPLQTVTKSVWRHVIAVSTVTEQLCNDSWHFCAIAVRIWSRALQITLINSIKLYY